MENSKRFNWFTSFNVSNINWFLKNNYRPVGLQGKEGPHGDDGEPG